MISLTWRPSIPPWLLTSLTHSWYPRWNAWPSAEKSPVSDSEAPIRIGCEPDALPDEPLPLLPQAASTAASNGSGVATAGGQHRREQRGGSRDGQEPGTD